MTISHASDYIDRGFVANQSYNNKSILINIQRQEIQKQTDFK